MSNTDARNVEQIRRDAERARANLTDTVQQLRESVTDAATDVRERFSPRAIKADVNNYVSSRVDDMADAARRNPLQAAAVGALVAWPALRIARSIPLPILMIGAGLFLTGSKTGKDLSHKAMDQAADLADEARRKAYDLRDAAAERASSVAETVRNAAQDAAERTSAVASDVVSRAREASDRASSAVTDALSHVQDAIPSVSSTRHATDGAATLAASAPGPSLADTAHDVADAAQTALSDARRRTRSLAEDTLAWAQANPLLAAGIGVAAGAFIASALPPTDTERNVAGAVSGAVRDAAKHGVTAAMGVAASAAFDAARTARDRGLDPETVRDVAEDYGQRAMKVAEAAADAALGQSPQHSEAQGYMGEQK